MQKRSWLFEKAAKYLLAAVLVIVPLFPKFPLITVGGTYVAVRFEDLLILVLGILVGINFVLNIKTYLKQKLFFAIAVFFFVGMLSTVSAAFLTQTISLKIGLLHLFRRLEYLIPFFAVLTLLPKQKASEYFNFYLKILVIVTAVAFVYGFGQRYFRFPIIITQNEEYSKGVALFWTPGSHINSTFAGHYDEAAVMVLLLSIFLALYPSVKEFWSKLSLACASLMGIWLLVNSLSRIAQVSYLVAVSVPLILSKKFKFLGFVAFVSLLIIGSSSGLAGRFSRIIEVFYKKISIGSPISYINQAFIVNAADTTLPLKRDSATPTPTPVPVFEDRSTSIRLNVEWPRAIRAFNKNIFLGTGYSSINLATDNDYLRLLGETGIFGFTSFWIIIFYLGSEFFEFYKNRAKFEENKRMFIFAVIGGALGTFLSVLFLDLFEASKFALLFWFLIGFSIYLKRSVLSDYENI